MTPFLVLLLLLGLLELNVQGAGMRAWWLVLPPVGLALAASYPLALRVGLPAFEQAVFVDALPGIVAALCMTSIVSLVALLSTPRSMIAAVSARLWLGLASPLGLLAVITLQWRLFYHVDGWPYGLLSVCLGLAISAWVALALKLRPPPGWRVWLVYGQLALAITAGALAAAQQALPASTLTFNPQALLGWLVLMAVCAGAGAAAMRSFRWT